MRDLGLPNPAIYVALPSLNDNLSPANHAEVMDLIKEYADLFSSSPHDFRLLKRTSHHLKLEYNRPLRSQLFWKSKVGEAQVLIKLKKLLNAGLLRT